MNLGRETGSRVALETRGGRSQASRPKAYKLASSHFLALNSVRFRGSGTSRTGYNSSCELWKLQYAVRGDPLITPGTRRRPDGVRRCYHRCAMISGFVFLHTVRETNHPPYTDIYPTTCPTVDVEDSKPSRQPDSPTCWEARVAYRSCPGFSKVGKASRLTTCRDGFRECPQGEPREFVGSQAGPRKATSTTFQVLQCKARTALRRTRSAKCLVWTSVRRRHRHPCQRHDAPSRRGGPFENASVVPCAFNTQARLGSLPSRHASAPDASNAGDRRRGRMATRRPLYPRPWTVMTAVRQVKSDVRVPAAGCSVVAHGWESDTRCLVLLRYSVLHFLIPSPYPGVRCEDSCGCGCRYARLERQLT
ncbi:hypothetical protein K466DRAFT_139313 [Polyporus arcularius HHB13444]|uniref:Uncharacterized protein n=1 Tax=Polyporus arcularius HHB13444 TaxID=1314778 RepID=A0A5C3PCZ5_9APHY|nr:hypothetical protein K466DRAFT_139313 [Polyporus arcularius HHB13444]